MRCASNVSKVYLVQYSTVLRGVNLSGSRYSKKYSSAPETHYWRYCKIHLFPRAGSGNTEAHLPSVWYSTVLGALSTLH